VRNLRRLTQRVSEGSLAAAGGLVTTGGGGAPAGGSTLQERRTLVASPATSVAPAEGSFGAIDQQLLTVYTR
jgi:hypothetical protein